MNTSLTATASSVLAPKYRALLQFFRRPAFLWIWTYRIPLLKSLFSLIVIAWTIPPAYQALHSPKIVKYTILLLLFTLFVLRRSFNFNLKQIFSSKEPTQ